MNKTIAIAGLALVGSVLPMAAADATDGIVQPTFDPAYVPMDGKPNSIQIECAGPDTVRFSFTPWHLGGGWLGIEDSAGNNGVFQREWSYGESVILPNRAGLEVVYYSGGEYRYGIVPGQCAPSTPPPAPSPAPPTVAPVAAPPADASGTQVEGQAQPPLNSAPAGPTAFGYTGVSNSVKAAGIAVLMILMGVAVLLVRREVGQWRRTVR